jgi:hypothetical protein
MEERMTRKDALTALLEKVEAGEHWHFSETPPPEGFPEIWVDAFNGSLDAAFALHNAVLPGDWWFIISGGHVRVGTEPLCENEFFAEVENQPARAWLLAILKALLSQEEGE